MDFNKDACYELFEFFWLVKLWIYEKFLKYGVYDTKANLGANHLQLVSHSLGVLCVNNVVKEVVTSSALDDLGGYANCHLVFFLTMVL